MGDNALNRSTVTNKTSGRNYGLDLLKIVIMFCIVLFHFNDHGNVKLSAEMPLTLNWIALAFVSIFGAIGNCIFIFITGYFLCEKNFRIRRLSLLWAQVFFYSVLCRIITIAAGIDPLNIKMLVKTLMPVAFNRYWYFSAYVVILIASPFLNLIIRNLSQRQHFWLCVALLILFSVIPTVTKGSWFGGEIGKENYLKIFITLYFVAAYIKFYGIRIIKKQSVYLMLTIALIALEILSIFAIRFVSILLHHDFSLIAFTWGMDKINIIAVSISIFMLFKGMNIKGNKALASISASTFSIYLLHVGTWRLVFGVIFNNELTYNTPWMIPQMFMCAISVCVVAIAVDKIRIYMLEKPLIKILDKIPVGQKIDGLFGKI